MADERQTMKDVSHTPPDGVGAADVWRRGIDRKDDTDADEEPHEQPND